jgi:hypothetical protein
MEFAVLPKNSLRIKSKQAAIVIDQQDKNDYSASLVLGKTVSELTQPENGIVIAAPGEYEVGGIKITGVRSESGMIYTLLVDNVVIVVGQIAALNKMHAKLADNNVVIVLCDTTEDTAFLTSLATNVIALYGDQAESVAQTFGQDKVKKMTKYSSTREKLPTEVETILLG